MAGHREDAGPASSVPAPTDIRDRQDRFWRTNPAGFPTCPKKTMKTFATIDSPGRKGLATLRWNGKTEEKLSTYLFTNVGNPSGKPVDYSPFRCGKPVDESEANVENPKPSRSLWITRHVIHIIPQSYPQRRSLVDANSRKLCAVFSTLSTGLITTTTLRSSPITTVVTVASRASEATRTGHRLE